MKKKVVPALVTLLSTTMVALMSATIAWFTSKATIDIRNNLTGSSAGAYFAYGNGTAVDDPNTAIKEGPYGITTPRHLYNLAWLQYLGRFNLVDSNAIVPQYFELGDNIDMTGWVLPPIGTTTNPFIGEFNGNGYTISNLTVSNNYNEILATNKIPVKVKNDGASAFTGVNIVGVFGVVGNYNNVISATYDSSVTSVKDFTIDSATVKNSLSNTLIGIAAGYVNGPLEGVGVASSSISMGSSQKFGNFTNISDYGVIGFAEPAYRQTIENTVGEVYNATSTNYTYIAPNEGDEAGWGGSIDMKTMYNEIFDAWDSFDADDHFDANNPDAGGTYQYPTTRTIVENEQGQVTSDTYGGYTNYTFTNVNGTGHYYTKAYKDGDYVTSRYTLAHRSNTDRYMYIYGQNEITKSNSVTVNRTYYDTLANCFVISLEVNGTTHYLTTTNGTAISDSTTFDGATAWAIDNNNRIYTVINGTNYYYLRYNNGNLALTNSTTNATSWTRNTTNGSISYTYNNTNYFIYYDNGWTLKSIAADSEYYLFYCNGVYLADSGSYRVTSSTNSNDTSTHWLFSGTYYYPVGSGNTNRYLGYYDSSYPVQAGSDSRGMYLYTTNYLSAQYNGSTYYAYYNGSSWTASTTRPTNTSYYVTMTHVGSSVSYDGLDFSSKTGPYVRQTQTSTENGKFNTLSTYFPLNQKIDQVATSTVRGYYLYYTINGQNYYMVYDTSVADTNLSYTTEEEEATIWKINTNSVSPESNTGVYLNRTSNSNDNVRVSNSNNRRYAFNNNTLTYSGGNNTRNYVYFNGTSWQNRTQTSTINRTTVYVTNAVYTGKPREANTGYVVGGANDINEQGNIRVSQYYGVNNSNGSSLQGTSYSNGAATINTIYTIKNDNMSSSQITDLTAYKNLETAKESLEGVLTSDTTWVYGLHFMEADIDHGIAYQSDGTTINEKQSESAFAQKAMVNGKTYYNYELPVNCIDFNLKEKGFINFIAGAYFGSTSTNGYKNNCFFSLYEIQRDANNRIVQIRPIQAVYSDNVDHHSNIYEYKTYDNNTDNKRYSVPFQFVNGRKVTLDNGTYTEYSSSGSLYSGYTKVFNCKWIDSKATLQTSTSGDNFRGYPYYFEIPMNLGEYALGSPSFDGANGAYLMYLDIGANAQKVYRSEMIELFKFIKETYTYPKGVGIVLAAGNAVSDQNSYCVCIKTSYNGTLTMEKVQNGDVEEGKYTGTGDATQELVSYKHPNLILHDENGNIKTATPTSTDETVIKRLTYFDYYVNSGTANKIVITDTTSGGETTRTVEKYTNFDLETQTGTEDENLKIYVLVGEDLIDATKTPAQVTFATDGNTTKILVFNVLYPNGSTVTITFTITVSGTDGGGYTIYSPAGYNIGITLTNGQGQSTDITADCFVTVVTNSDGTYTYTFWINGTSPVAGGSPIVITVGS